MGELETIAFTIIASVGTAKSNFMEALSHARKGEFDKAEELIEEGEAHRIKGHEAHFELIQKEANGEKTEIGILLMHAEDQLMASETIKIMAEEFIYNYREIETLKALVKGN